MLTTATIDNQGLVDISQAAVTGLEAKKPCFLATSLQADGSGLLVPIARFMSNPARAAIVDAVGALRSTLAAGGSTPAAGGSTPRQYLVVATEQDGKPGKALQISRRTGQGKVRPNASERFRPDSGGQRTEDGVPADSRVIDNAVPQGAHHATLSLTVRLVCAAIAAATTLLLLFAVVSIAAPQRDMLIARNHHFETPSSAPVALAMSSNETARDDK